MEELIIPKNLGTNPKKLGLAAETASWRVSVIIPTKNRAKLLVEAIESVLAQTVQPFEIIVIDDGSTDDTSSVLNHYKRKIRLIRNEISQGPAAARNKGVGEARGELLAFLDSDDLWLPSKLEKQLGVLTKRPQAGMVYTDCVFLNLESGVADVEPAGQNRALPSGWIFERVLLEWLIPLPSVLMPASVFREQGGFNQELFVAEDLHLWARIALSYPIEVVSEPLVVVRRHPGNISRFSERESDDYLHHLKLIESVMPVDYPKKRCLLSEARSRWHWIQVLSHFNLGRYGPARISARQCLGYPRRRGRALAMVAVLFMPAPVIAHIRGIVRRFRVWQSTR